MTFRTTLTFGAAAAALLLGACATPSLEQKAAVTTAAVAATAAPTPTAAAPAPQASMAATAQSGVATVDLASSRAAPATDWASKATPYVYFDFDSAQIRDDFKGSIDAHARQLLAQPDKRLRIEGHTDERGGSEYNLALGQQRAESVANALRLLGVAEGRLEVVSFGEERPKAEGSSEEAWSKNRRAALRSDRAERTAQPGTRR